jgi:tripartite-type tricarboxylate transporter receptor subunit TctC
MRAMAEWRMPIRALLVVLLLGLVPAAQAAYPEKPIRFVLPSAAGGSVDVLMRILAQQLSVQMGVPLVVENKPGASFVLGTMDIVRAPPDGYTIGYGNIVSLAVNRTLLSKLPYDVEKDLTLVSNCVQVFNMLAVNNDLPVRSVAELIAYAKKNPGKLTNGSSGNGTTGHLGGELFKSMAGVEIVHVPYKGSPQAINDLIAGNIQVMFDNVPSIGPHVKSGRVRGLGVSAPKRAGSFPDVPTIAEAGVPGYETNSWGGVIGPAKLPAEIVSRLNAEVRKALATPAVIERYKQLDTEPDGGTPEQFMDLVRRETPKWGEVIKRSGAKID